MRRPPRSRRDRSGQGAGTLGTDARHRTFASTAHKCKIFGNKACRCKQSQMIERERERQRGTDRERERERERDVVCTLHTSKTYPWKHLPFERPFENRPGSQGRCWVEPAVWALVPGRPACASWKTSLVCSMLGGRVLMPFAEDRVELRRRGLRKLATRGLASSVGRACARA